MPVPKLTVLLMAHDEEARLEAFFAALKGLGPHRVIVVEHGSKDATAALARSHGAKLLHLPWEGFAATKNRGIEACPPGWVLSLDADENPSPELCASIRRVVESPAGSVPQGWHVRRLNYFLRLPLRHGGWYPDRQLRLFKKGSARFNDRLVHEGMEMLPGQGGTGELQGDLHHYSYPSVQSYLDRLNRYTSLQAEELMRRKGAKPATAAFRLVADPPLTFAKMALLKRGFLDGKVGWIVAALSASSTFWKYAKWWHLSWQAKGGREGTPWVLK